MKLEDAKAKVRECFCRLINARDLSVCDELLAGDYVDHDAPVDAPPGPAETKQLVARMPKDRPDTKSRLRMPAPRARVALRNIWRWTDGESDEKRRQMGTCPAPE
jgi:hypothetical protein